jgi:hypothetical protein
VSFADVFGLSLPDADLATVLDTIERNGGPPHPSFADAGWHGAPPSRPLSWLGRPSQICFADRYVVEQLMDRIDDDMPFGSLKSLRDFPL